ncbi:hypothetical protein F2Q69_00007880 [Brassica cretica]|uniref:Uncharacterized protein n=1 Tax=Brassica cretica TaxID=69181 RepID=A0A8S9P5V2_BRACR|nr:hypothetical protein F2Q69_00007880 [Brassica cretica]
MSSYMPKIPARRHIHVQMACCMAGVHASRHTAPLRVDQHASVADTTTPRASTCQAACAASMHGDNSSFCRHSDA